MPEPSHLMGIQGAAQQPVRRRHHHRNASARGSPSKAAGSLSCRPRGDLLHRRRALLRRPNLGILKEAHAGEATAWNGRDPRPSTSTPPPSPSASAHSPACSTASARPPSSASKAFSPGCCSPCRNRASATATRPRPMPPAARDQYPAKVTTLTVAERPRRARCPHVRPGRRRRPSRGSWPPSSRGSRPVADLAHMTDWGGKLAGAIVRIAALLHLAEHARDGWDRPITLATLKPPPSRQLLHPPRQSRLRHHRRRPRHRQRPRHPAMAHHHPARPGHHPRPHARHARPLPQGRRPRRALQILESRGWIRPRPGSRPKAGGGPARPAWDVHPAIVSQP